MNQYIITDEDISAITDYVLGAFYEGENKEKMYDLIKAQVSVIRSHPYNPQAEREKVLDEVLEAICDDPPSDNGVESTDRICGILERIRKKGNTEDR